MPAPLQYLQSSFIRGMNQQVDGSRLAADEYSLLVNGRNRYDTLDPITKPVDVTPTGVTKVQGCYAAGALLVCFADGKAFYRNEGLANQTFTQIPGFQMSAAVDTLYAVLVPASTVNGARKLANAANTSLGVLLSGTSSSTPQAMLVQDGVNQGMLIFPDGSVRVTQNYNQWTPDNREYVPIGKQMLFNSGILYIVSVDGLQIYRSVTGRPLDSMVIIDVNGNKLPSEGDGGASQISHKVDYAPITAIAALSSPDGSFYVSTARTSYAVRPDFAVLPYGEPTFVNTFLFTTGAVNNFSIADILGDNAIIDYSGIRSFNSVGQYRIEGKNSPFSAKINRLLTGIRQVTPAAVTFDNYGLFSVETVFGTGILVFDTITQQWSSLDLMPSLSAQVIQMFAEVKTSVNRKLFCSTAAKVFELYPETGTTETPAYYTPEFNSGDPAVAQKSTLLRLTFLDVLTPGTVWVTPVEDGKVGTQRAARLQNVLPDSQASVPPVLQRGTDKVRVATVPLNDIAKSCWKTGMYIRWNFSGKLAAVKLISNSQVSDVSLEEQVAMSAVNPLFIATVGATEFVAGATLHIFGGGFGGGGGGGGGGFGGGGGAITVLLNGIDVDFVIAADGWITVTLPSSWVAGTPVLTVDITTSGGSRFVWVAGLMPADGSGIDRDNSSSGAGGSLRSGIMLGWGINSSGAGVTGGGGSGGSGGSTGAAGGLLSTGSNGGGGAYLDVGAIDFTAPVDVAVQKVIAATSPPPSVPSVTITNPPQTPATTPSAGACSRTFTLDNAFEVVPGQFVLDATAAAQSQTVFAGFIFQLNSNGTYTYVSPLWSGHIKASNTSLNQMGQTFKPGTTERFQLNGITFCVSFAGTAVTPDPDPEPPVEDPCDSSYPATILVDAASTVGSGACSIGEIYLPFTLAKTTVDGLCQYNGFGYFDFPDCPSGGLSTRCRVDVSIVKDNPAHVGFWYLVATVTGSGSVPTMEASAELGVITACAPISIPYGYTVTGTWGTGTIQLAT